MIRLVYVLRRRPNLSREEFQRYWRENHGPLVAKHATAMRVRRYVQSHTTNDPANEAMRQPRGFLEPYDGVAELWWDNLEVLAAQAQSPESQQAAQELLEDERKFIDFSRSSAWFAVEHPQVNPTPENLVAHEDSPIVKLFYVFHHRPELSFEEAQLYWRMNHGPIIRHWAPVTGVKRYLQVHMVPGPFADSMRAARGGMDEAFTGHAELWYDRRETAVARTTPEYERAMPLIVQDEAKFIDFPRSAIWFVKEHVFVDR